MGYGLFGSPQKKKRFSPEVVANRERRSNLCSVDRKLTSLRRNKKRSLVQKAEINMLVEEKRKLNKAVKSSQMGIHKETNDERLQREAVMRKRGF